MPKEQDVLRICRPEPVVAALAATRRSPSCVDLFAVSTSIQPVNTIVVAFLANSDRHRANETTTIPPP